MRRREVSLPDGGVGRWVDVDLNLGPTGSIADPLSNLTSSPVCVWQVVEPGQRIRQQADVGTAETEALPLRSPFRCHDSSWSGLALLDLMFVRSVEGKTTNTLCHITFGRPCSIYWNKRKKEINRRLNRKFGIQAAEQNEFTLKSSIFSFAFRCWNCHFRLTELTNLRSVSQLAFPLEQFWNK